MHPDMQVRSTLDLTTTLDIQSRTAARVNTSAEPGRRDRSAEAGIIMRMVDADLQTVHFDTEVKRRGSDI